MGLGMILIVVGVVCFVLDAIHIPIGNISLFPLGWAFVITGALVVH